MLAIENRAISWGKDSRNGVEQLLDGEVGDNEPDCQRSFRQTEVGAHCLPSLASLISSSLMRAAFSETPCPTGEGARCLRVADIVVVLIVIGI